MVVWALISVELFYLDHTGNQAKVVFKEAGVSLVRASFKRNYEGKVSAKVA